jgi:salicylate hydroxylase
MNTHHVGIIGAGIGGLSAALALQRAGVRVRVFEQSPQLGEVGAGISLSPTAAHALNDLGLHGTLESKAYKPEDQCVRHWRDGRPLAWVNRGQALFDKYGERYYLIHRADLHDALASAVRANDPEAIVLDARCVAISQDEQGATLKLASGASYSFEVLVGADGSRSVVRHHLFGALEPQYTGYIAWRGLVPLHLVPKEILEPPSGVFVGPGHLVNRYPVRNGELLALVSLPGAPTTKSARPSPSRSYTINWV